MSIAGSLSGNLNGIIKTKRNTHKPHGPSPALRASSPQGARGKLHLFALWDVICSTNSSLAPWGEGVT